MALGAPRKHEPSHHIDDLFAFNTLIGIDRQGLVGDRNAA
jgi:hypothetical protein